MKSSQPSNSINNQFRQANMNSLRHINNYLDEDIKNRFDLDEFIQEDTKKEALDCFDRYFEDMYNGDMDYIDLGELKQLCDFNRVMEICAFVADKYDEYDMTMDKQYFEDKDKIIKSYIYFYYCETHKQEFIQQIEEYDFDTIPIN